MPIYFNKKTNEFHLQGAEVSYIFYILPNNQLGHLYYGRKIKHRESFAHLGKIKTRGAVASVFEGNREFSLDLIKQEYPSYGTTDFREPAYQILQEDGSRITDFQYKGHQIFKGKLSLEGLPSTYVEHDHEATSLAIFLYDDLLEVEIQLLYTVYEDFNIITRSATFTNEGRQNLRLTRAMSISVDFPDSKFEMIHLSGSWARERHVKIRPLESGIQSITSTRGASSSQQNPFLALKRKHTTEFQGEVFGFSLVYSGNFLAQVEVDQFDVARVIMGIHPFDFSWCIKGNESFQTPEVVMVYSDQGLNGMSQAYHQLYRTRLARGHWRDKERPILMNNWEATYFHFNEDKIMELAKASKELGVELFVLDDGWFGKRNDATSSLGDWFVNEEKLPNGISGLAKKITEIGLMFGLWFEPEMISKESQLYKKHSDWLIHVPNRHLSHGRYQFVLDFSREEVVNFIYKVMANMLDEAPISYVKWDMNRFMTEIGSATLAIERQQEVAHRYILGVYNLYDRLTNRFPHILFESCASGGARFDPALLQYAPQTWTSDNTDAIERLKIQYGTSFVYPLSSMGAHVSVVPNHQVKRITPLKTRANAAYFGVFGYELDLTKLTNTEKEEIKKQIHFYKENRELFQFGSFYRIKSPFEDDGNITCWIVVSKDQKTAIAAYFQVLAVPNPGFQHFKLTGLNPSFEYKIEGFSGTYYGDELMNAGFRLTNEHFDTKVGLENQGDFGSILFKLIKV
ncbi:alpha-galactosidase [Bacillus sp. 03113]|uniref:alpha-galactosidase n=1 Tax=Bacillus sp. 03113 TaxID=2578211 RepID=UPI001143CFDB|nr:alpha-galactosidase [Bacillus sp. 03113]